MNIVKMVHKVIILVSIAVMAAAVIANSTSNAKEKTVEQTIDSSGAENYILGNEDETLKIDKFNISTTGSTPELFIIEDKDFGFVISYIWRRAGTFTPIPVSITRPSPQTPSEIKSGVVIISNAPYKVYRVISVSKESISYVVYAGGNIAPHIETFRTDYSLPLRSAK